MYFVHLYSMLEITQKKVSGENFKGESLGGKVSLRMFKGESML